MNYRWLCMIGAALVGLGGCAARPDVEIAGPTLALDTTNPIFPVLSKQLSSHKGATTFRVSWTITPDPKRPIESLPHSLVYDRKAKTLAIHRDQTNFQQFSGVTDAILQSLAAKNGSAGQLTDAGCIPQMLPEP
ncbi:hypothetical protein IAD21_02504 [Abditibacteriota bacterium]|nr:hypothetical protein IAD21_02504 [Abditibacteriota bacterium]